MVHSGFICVQLTYRSIVPLSKMCSMSFSRWAMYLCLYSTPIERRVLTGKLGKMWAVCKAFGNVGEDDVVCVYDNCTYNPSDSLIEMGLVVMRRCCMGFITGKCNFLCHQCLLPLQIHCWKRCNVDLFMLWG